MKKKKRKKKKEKKDNQTRAIKNVLRFDSLKQNKKSWSLFWTILVFVVPFCFNFFDLRVIEEDLMYHII